MVDDGLRLRGRPVISVEGEIKGADGDFSLLEKLDVAGEAMGEGNAASAHTDEDEGIGGLVLLDDFMGNAGEGAADVIRAHDDFFSH